MMDGSDALTFVDTHAHLDEPVFDRDRVGVLAEASAAGVGQVVNIGYRPQRWATTMALASQHPEIAITLGVHPHHADELTPDVLDRLAATLVGSNVVAVGEIGLDLYRDGPSLALQERAFAAQLELAHRLGLPVVIHQRAAEPELIAMLSGAPPELRVILHSFDGTERLAEFGRERGYYFGVGGLMTRRAAESLRAIIARLPLERILLETDSPYLVPTGVKDRRNVPANIPRIAARLADLRQLSIDEVARRTTENARRAFR